MTTLCINVLIIGPLAVSAQEADGAGAEREQQKIGQNFTQPLLYKTAQHKAYNLYSGSKFCSLLLECFQLLQTSPLVLVDKNYVTA